jgi:hypothetical protein
VTAGTTEFQVVYGGPGDGVLADEGAELIYNQFYGEDGDDAPYGGQETDEIDGGPGDDEVHQD